MNRQDDIQPGGPRVADAHQTNASIIRLAAQARSLGFSLVFATQDIPAMLRNDDKEAQSMIANTTTKIFMRVEETEMTAKLAVDSAGKGNFARVSGFAPSIMLEEVGVHYSVHLVNLGSGEQHAPQFLAVSPNGKIPAIVDHNGVGGPRTVFESGAILCTSRTRPECCCQNRAVAANKRCPGSSGR